MVIAGKNGRELAFQKVENESTLNRVVAWKKPLF
jgi:hypothetical protein